MKTTKINLLYSKPKIHIAKKKFNYKLIPCIEKGHKWYVYYYYLNPVTKKLDKFIETQGVNEIDNLEIRTNAIKNLREAVELYLLEYNPYENKQEPILCNGLWTKPKIFIAANNIDEELHIDKNSNWYVYYHFLDSKTNNLKLFKAFSNFKEIQNTDERILTLKNLQYSLEQKLSNGYNPFNEELTHKITDSQLKYYQKLDEERHNSQSKYSSVFKSLELEKIFHEILINENVINKENMPKRKFNTVTYNSFKIANRIQNQLFNTESLKTFVEFLEDKYNFKPKNKTKFANINNKLNSKIANFVEQKLEEHENSQKRTKANL